MHLCLSAVVLSMRSCSFFGSALYILSASKPLQWCAWSACAEDDVSPTYYDGTIIISFCPANRRHIFSSSQSSQNGARCRPLGIESDPHPSSLHVYMGINANLRPAAVQTAGEAPSIIPYNVISYMCVLYIHSSCEIEYFVETHLCKLYVILLSRVLRVVCRRSATPLATTAV